MTEVSADGFTAFTSGAGLAAALDDFGMLVPGEVFLSVLNP